jgi:hypothetical protein
MIFSRPADGDPIDQGDVIDDCPILWHAYWDLDRQPMVQVKEFLSRVIVLTQTCDLAQAKTIWAIVAMVFPAQKLVDDGILKSADIRGPVRGGRTWGWYFLPKADDLDLPESIVDLRQLHTVRLDMLRSLCQRRKRSARLQPLYREHLNKFFGDTYSRIGLPQQYPTD